MSSYTDAAERLQQEIAARERAEMACQVAQKERDELRAKIATARQAADEFVARADVRYREALAVTCGLLLCQAEIKLDSVREGVRQIENALENLLIECDYSESSGFPFGSGWTQRKKARKALADFRAAHPHEKTNEQVS